ncbi:MAG: ABC transporter permease [Lysobacteraceae bacterium]|jgi:lipopolysaccharide transport system permease protein|nr:ABC transporter permease [Xanthomonadaceae bacterium]MCZ8318669.1 ABC transporter permease [Silanimonas sp.]
MAVAHRAVLRELLAREWRERYQGSLLGGAWLGLQPLLQLGVLALVFGTLLPARAGGAGLPYPAFLALGLFPWLLFANAVNRATTTYLDHAGLIARVPLPASLYVHARVLASVLVDGLGLLVVVVLLVATGLRPTPAGLAVALAGLAVLSIAALALARIVALLQVFVRDLAAIVGQLTGLGFFLSPVLYARDQLPPSTAAWLAWNPLAAPLEAVRHGLAGDVPVAWGALLPGAVAAAVLLLASVALQRRAGRHLEDFL